MIYRIERQLADGNLKLSSREMYMMEHPARDPNCPFKPGDVVKLEEGYFILNEDLNPMELATEAEIDRAEGSE